jgi:uncharacterized protein YxjI
MAVEVSCSCGAAYRLKDEFQGRLLKCTACGQSFAATAPPPIARAAQADAVFEHDKFLLRQKALAISEHYTVSDEQGADLCFIVRPAHVGRTVLAALGVLAWIVLGVAALVGVGSLIGFNMNRPGAVELAFVVVGGLFVLVLAVVIGIALSPKRHVLFYRDRERQQKLLEVLQDSKWQLIVRTFTCRDPDGTVLAHFHKNVLYDFFRKRWDALKADRSALLCRAVEDSILLSLLRRWLGTLFGVLRTNFIITGPDGQQIVGEFNRKFTLLDRYVLDLTQDPARQLDRRVALALGVMLDTGERR